MAIKETNEWCPVINGSHLATWKLIESVEKGNDAVRQVIADWGLSASDEASDGLPFHYRMRGLTE